MQRKQFTREQSLRLRTYLEKLADNGYTKFSGNAIYQEFAAKNPQHPWSSWREHGMKVIVPTLKLDARKSKASVQKVDPVDNQLEAVLVDHVKSPVKPTPALKADKSPVAKPIIRASPYQKLTTPTGPAIKQTTPYNSPSKIPSLINPGSVPQSTAASPSALFSPRKGPPAMTLDFKSPSKFASPLKQQATGSPTKPSFSTPTKKAVAKINSQAAQLNVYENDEDPFIGQTQVESERTLEDAMAKHEALFDEFMDKHGGKYSIKRLMASVHMCSGIFPVSEELLENDMDPVATATLKRYCFTQEEDDILMGTNAALIDQMKQRKGEKSVSFRFSYLHALVIEESKEN